MLIGLARVSTTTQDHALQVDALTKAGCERIFTETVSGMRKERSEPLAVHYLLSSWTVLFTTAVQRV